MRFFTINLVLIAALAVATPVLAEANVSANLNKTPLSDNLDTTERVIIRLAYIRTLALDNLRQVAPVQVEQLDNCLELVKQMADEWKWANVVSKVPAISPLQNFWQN